MTQRFQLFLMTHAFVRLFGFYFITLLVLDVILLLKSLQLNVSASNGPSLTEKSQPFLSELSKQKEINYMYTTTANSQTTPFHYEKLRTTAAMKGLSFELLHNSRFCYEAK